MPLASLPEFRESIDRVVQVQPNTAGEHLPARTPAPCRHPIQDCSKFRLGAPNGIDYLKLKNELVKAIDSPIFESYYLNSTQDPASDQQNSFHTWLKSAPPKGPKIRFQLYRLKELHCTCSSCGNQFDRQVQSEIDPICLTGTLRPRCTAVTRRLLAKLRPS